MKKNNKLARILIIVLAAIIWFWGYDSLNDYYTSFSNISKEIHTAGEVVEFGKNFQNKGMCADGYTISVNEFKILEYQEYIDTIDYVSDSSRLIPERIALVYVTITNINSTADGVMLTELSLHGIDNYVGMNHELLNAVNPELNGSAGIHLSSGESYDIILPYNLFEMHFGRDTWKDINSYSFYLHITSFPAEIDIAVN